MIHRTQTAAPRGKAPDLTNKPSDNQSVGIFRRYLSTYRWFLMAGLMAVVSLYLLTTVIRTPAEIVETTVRRMAQLVEREDILGLSTGISESYEGELENTKDALLESARDYFREVDGTRIRFEKIFVRVDGSRAEVLAVYFFRARLKSHDVYNEIPIVSLYQDNPSIPEKSYARFVKEDTQWRLVFIALDGSVWAARFPEAKKYFEGKRF